MDEPSIAYEGCPTWAPLPTAVRSFVYKRAEEGVVDFERQREHGSLRSLPGSPVDDLRPGPSPLVCPSNTSTAC
jgi:hypothetical protein